MGPWGRCCKILFSDWWVLIKAREIEAGSDSDVCAAVHVSELTDGKAAGTRDFSERGMS